MNFEHATAVVTGGGSGLGRAFCEQLGQAKAKVLIADINRESAEQTAQSVRAAGGSARVEVTDVREPAQVEQLARVADSWLGPTRLLINNAGVAVSGPVGEVSLDDWKWQLDINLNGVIYGCHYWVPRMKQAGGGHIINVGSAAGLLALPTMGPYNVTKAAVIALSETLHAEVRAWNVKVSVLCPSFFRTGIADSSRGVVDDATRAMVGKMMDANRVQASDVAKEALNAAAKGRLYCLPMPEIYAPWLLKRTLPNSFYRLLSLAGEREKLAGLLSRVRGRRSQTA